MKPSSVRLPAALAAAAIAVATPASAAAAPIAPPSPVSVAVVVPLTVPPTTSGLLDADALATYTRDGGLLDRQLDAVAGTGAAVGLDPMIPVSIRVLGTAAPDDARAFLDRLEGMPNDVFLLGYADADPALAVLADMTDELTPLGFDFAIDPANFGPAESPTPTPTPTGTTAPDPDATEPPADGPPPLPSTEELLAWTTSLPTIAWPAEGTLTADGVAGLAALGYEDVLVAGTNVSRGGSALVDLGGIGGLVADTKVTAAVRGAVYALSDTEFDTARVALEAALRAEATAAPGRTVIVTLDRRWPFGTVRLAPVLSAIAGSPSAQLVGLEDVLGGARVSASVTPPAEAEADAETARAATLSELAAAARAEAGYLRIADDPSPITQPRRLALLGLSAVGWRVDEAGWASATGDQLAAAVETLDAVQIVEGSDQLLLSDISSLRLQVSNALPVAVTVRLVLRPLRPLLHVEDPSVEVSIEPDSTATAGVPVQAITNGDVTVRAELHGTAGQTVGAPRLLKVILQAGWETAGTLIAGTLLVLIFGGGLVRTVLRRRRARTRPATDGDD